ncbi:MAG: hypothetical protein QM758_04110 [Armatimonas sp.]
MNRRTLLTTGLLLAAMSPATLAYSKPKLLVDAPALLGKTEPVVLKVLGKPSGKDDHELNFQRGKDSIDVHFDEKGKVYYIHISFKPERATPQEALAAGNVRVTGKPTDGRWITGILSKTVKDVWYGGEPGKIFSLHVCNKIMSDAG